MELKILAAPKIKISARFWTTSQLDREYLQTDKISSIGNGENGTRVSTHTKSTFSVVQGIRGVAP